MVSIEIFFAAIIAAALFGMALMKLVDDAIDRMEVNALKKEVSDFLSLMKKEFEKIPYIEDSLIKWRDQAPKDLTFMKQLYNQVMLLKQLVYDRINKK